MPISADEVMPQVAVNIRAARVAAGLTQEQLARKLDIVLRTVQSWEVDGRLPRGRNLEALCRVLDRDAGWFYSTHDTDLAA